MTWCNVQFYAKCKYCGSELVTWHQSVRTGKWYLCEVQDGIYSTFNPHICRQVASIRRYKAKILNGIAVFSPKYPPSRRPARSSAR